MDRESPVALGVIKADVNGVGSRMDVAVCVRPKAPPQNEEEIIFVDYIVVVMVD